MPVIRLKSVVFSAPFGPITAQPHLFDLKAGAVYALNPPNVFEIDITSSKVYSRTPFR
jgi:hypothetical protein